MKSKKKLLLLGVGAMGALAMGVGATSTFAWYQTTVSVSITKTASNGALTVTPTTSSADELDAQIHFFVDTSAASAIELTGWGTGDDANKLYKGLVPEGLTISDVRLTEVTSSIATYTLQLPVKAYITDESSDGEKAQENHNASWAAALNASRTTTKKVTFTYSSTDVAEKLNTAEVLFYTTEATAAYAKASEGVSGASGKTQQLDVAVSELTDGTYANTKKTEGTAATIGYLHVRFDGSQRLHSGAYGAEIVATAGDGAAEANA